MNSRLPTLAALLLLAAPAAAQINYTVGPEVVPQGCQVSITLSNDNPHKFGIVAPLYEVHDLQGNLIYVPTAPQVAVLMAPGGWFTFTWGLIDQAGQPVPPGRYILSVRFDFFVTPTQFPVQVVASGAGLVFEGTATIQPPFFSGPTRNFYLCSPDDPNQLYILLASLTGSAGLTTCGGTLPLDPDALFTLSLTPGAVFQGSVGQLNVNGVSFTPHFDLPANPNLVGLSLESAYAVLDPAGACIVRRISNPHTLTIH